MNYNKVNNLVGWLVFLISAVVYISTVEPSTSLWDCGEYITTSFKLEVGHPPGAPVFMMIGRIFSAFTSPESAAYMINIVSALSSAFAILFLFWTITHFARKIILNSDKTLTDASIYAIVGSGVVGALAYTFSDSFWFSAVEGEVYAMSSFFTAITFWAILKWEDNSHLISSDRWIILIFFLIGLSIGVHMLNLLVIPAAGFVYYFKKYDFSWKGFLITGVASIGILGFIQAVFINESINIASAFEKMFTNSLGTSFNVGTVGFFIFILGGLGVATYYFHVKGKRLAHVISVSLAVVIIGFASFAMIVVRSNANPPLDENDPESLPSLQSYLAREQYGSWPIAYGEYWNSPQKQTTENISSKKYFKAFVVNVRGIEKSFKTRFEAEKYIADNKLGALEIDEKYIITGQNYEQIYPPGSEDQYTTLPRMFDQRPEKAQGYMFWSDYKGNQNVIAKAPKVQNPDGRTYRDRYIPTTGENLRYLTHYQMGWMYWRYFLWNFAGRQNDIQGHNYHYTGDGMLYNGALTRGNWLSGVNFIDKERIGDQSVLPSTLSQDESYNKYFYLPLILGLLGLVFQIIKSPKDAFSTFLLFFFTGLAIVIYLNQRPEEPRERDYAYAASFYAFAIWIGLGVLAIYQWGKELSMKDFQKGAMVAGFASFLFLGADYVNGGGLAFGYSILYMSVIGLALVGLGILINKSLKNNKSLAIVATVLGLIAPILMGVQNWDDHDRSGRYFARDIAHNYLSSCEKNAILFCFGDNDTFPLWFAQEVEGFRTDMKVINYSLLSSDWHYNQMKRKTYEAPPVETILEEPDYRAGTRDYIFVGKNNTPIEAKAFVNYMKQGKDIDPRTSRFGYSSMPFNTIYINVDKQAAIDNGLVRPEQANQMVDRIQWTISGNGFSKADLAIIDLLATYKWDRPLYFTSTFIQGANRGLSDYLQEEGIASKFVPIRNPGHNKEKMYKLFMGEPIDVNGDEINDKFEWGGLKNEGVFCDYYTMRMVRSSRIHFMRLAQTFTRSAQAMERASINDTAGVKNPKIEEERQKAINILDKHFEELPIGRVKIDELTGYLATMYYEAGDTAKGDLYCDKLAAIYKENMDFFAAQNQDYITDMIQEIGSFMTYFTILEQGRGDDKYSLKNIAPDAYNTLGQKINSAMTFSPDFNMMMRTDIANFIQSRGRSRSILPYSFMQEKMPQFFQQ